MSFNFNGVPSAEVSISGDVSTENPLTNLKTISYDGSGLSGSSVVPVGKKWVIMGVGSKLYTAEGGVYATVSGAQIYLCSKLGSPEFFTDYAVLPLKLSAGDSVRFDEDGMISYYEFDE